MNGGMRKKITAAFFSGVVTSIDVAFTYLLISEYGHPSVFPGEGIGLAFFVYILLIVLGLALTWYAIIE